jgi:hypothetical protein
MFKEMSMTLRRIEDHPTTRIQVGGMRATSTTNMVHEVMGEK